MVVLHMAVSGPCRGVWEHPQGFTGDTNAKGLSLVWKVVTLACPVQGMDVHTK